jgi:hypothetical protein
MKKLLLFSFLLFSGNNLVGQPPSRQSNACRIFWAEKRPTLAELRREGFVPHEEGYPEYHKVVADTIMVGYLHDDKTKVVEQKFVHIKMPGKDLGQLQAFLTENGAFLMTSLCSLPDKYPSFAVSQAGNSSIIFACVLAYRGEELGWQLEITHIYPRKTSRQRPRRGLPVILD